MRNSVSNESVAVTRRMLVYVHTVLSGFWSNLAAHLVRSPLNYSYGYGPAGQPNGKVPMPFLIEI